MLVLVRCCERFSSGNFEHYFAKAFGNYIRKLRAYNNRPMRKGVELPIDVLEGSHQTTAHNYHGPHTKTMNPGFDRSQEFVRDQNEQKVLEGLRGRAKQLLPLLSSEAVRLLQMVTDPRRTAEAEEQAYNEYLRRKHLRALGIRCPGRNRFRIERRHFRKALGMSRSELRSAIREIQSVDFILKRGGSRWPRSKK